MSAMGAAMARRAAVSLPGRDVNAGAVEKKRPPTGMLPLSMPAPSRSATTDPVVVVVVVNVVMVVVVSVRDEVVVVTAVVFVVVVDVGVVTFGVSTMMTSTVPRAQSRLPGLELACTTNVHSCVTAIAKLRRERMSPDRDDANPNAVLQRGGLLRPGTRV